MIDLSNLDFKEKIDMEEFCYKSKKIKFCKNSKLVQNSKLDQKNENFMKNSKLDQKYENLMKNSKLDKNLNFDYKIRNSDFEKKTKKNSEKEVKKNKKNDIFSKEYLKKYFYLKIDDFEFESKINFIYKFLKNCLESKIFLEKKWIIHHYNKIKQISKLKKNFSDLIFENEKEKDFKKQFEKFLKKKNIINFQNFEKNKKNYKNFSKKSKIFNFEKKREKIKLELYDLLYRFWREFILEENSPIKNIFENENDINKPLILSISDVVIKKKKILIEFSDGFYNIYYEYKNINNLEKKKI